MILIEKLKTTKCFDIMKKILLIEDSIEISELVEIHLKNLGFHLEKAFDGEMGLRKAKNNQYHLIILDLFLPKIGGMEICDALRKHGDSTPILMLSARSENADKLKGFNLGANAYLTKPFNLQSLTDSVKALLDKKKVETLKPNRSTCELLVFKHFTLDTEQQILKINGRIIHMDQKEYQLLSLLACNPGIVYSRSEILKEIWGFDLQAYRYKVTSYISKIRQKIEPNFLKPYYILVSPNGSFKFNEKIVPMNK